MYVQALGTVRSVNECSSFLIYCYLVYTHYISCVSLLFNDEITIHLFSFISFLPISEK